ncbi:hypothetical protein FHS54_003104 [Sphingobium vermicomposti]|uniref:Uncharacterized protein n=1 Tax=Sphingobium vermicomposti TaxID=529005 RepID=A0A846MD60_9SPHN|nr:hypothetical protein [Sphingobium vermicomposti]
MPADSSTCTTCALDDVAAAQSLVANYSDVQEYFFPVVLLYRPVFTGSYIVYYNYGYCGGSRQ